MVEWSDLVGRKVYYWDSQGRHRVGVVRRILSRNVLVVGVYDPYTGRRTIRRRVRRDSVQCVIRGANTQEPIEGMPTPERRRRLRVVARGLISVQRPPRKQRRKRRRG